jgi:pilus assembly protein CpaB
MKNVKAIGLLLAALVIGLVAAVYAANWASRQSDGAATRVVVAAVDVELGTRLSPEMLTVVEWPTGAVPAGAFSSLDALQGRVLRVGVLRGDALIERKLAPAGAQGGLSAVITQGKRAMTVRVNDVVGVAGFALPGTFVDVMVNTQRGRGDDGHISKTVLEQVLVLAVAQEASRDETQPKVVSAVTLELTPQDAEKLDLARSVGTLSLVLRNQVDRQRVNTVGTTKQQLLDASAAPRAAGAPLAARTPGRVAAARPSTHQAKPSAAPDPAPVDHGAHAEPAAPAVVAAPAAVAPPAAVAAPAAVVAPAARPSPETVDGAAPAAPRPCVEVIHNGARVVHCF